MTADRWARIHDLFELCLDQPPESRASFLANQSVDPDIRTEVEKLLQQDRIAGSFMAESPDLVKELRAAPRSQFSPGDRLGRRFELLRLIGRGGMGEVYAALDVDLEEQVAIKVLHADLLTDAGATQRFRRELQLARKVTHPNVCRLFDLGRHPTPQGDVFFLTMELVEGETLAERLRRGPFTVDEARPIVEQLLHGLSAAHHAGIIHRDLKPSNVMLTGPRAVIMDFGLARRDTSLTDGSLTSSGKVLGTLDYMAPEQLRGEPVTERTDLYALGLILYEMLTGTRPFARADSVAGALARLTESPAKLPARAPKNWARTAAALLEPDPQYRPASAPQVLEHLRGPGPRRRLTRRQLATAAAISAGGLSLYWGGSRLKGEEQLNLPEGAWLIMTDASGSERAPALTEVFRQQLAQSARFNLVDRRVMLAAQERMARKPETSGLYWREVALRAGAKAVVYPTVNPVGDGFTVSLRVELLSGDPYSTRAIRQHSVSARSEASVFEAIHENGRWLRSVVGERADSATFQDLAAEASTTSSWEALRLFRAAEDYKREDKREDAVLALQQAVRLDPDFALGHARLADILVNLRRYAEGFEHWDRALTSTGNRRLTARETLRVRGMYALDAEEWSAAEAVWSDAIRIYPRDSVALFYLADAKRHLGKHVEALELMNRSDRLDPDRLYTIEKLVVMNLAVSEPKLAQQQADRAERIGRGDWAIGYRGVVAELTGDSDNALHQYRSLANNPKTREAGLRLAARLLLNLNRFNDAEKELSTGLTPGPGSYSPTAGIRLDLAYAQFRQRNLWEARANALEAVRLDASVDILSQAGCLLARLGRPEEGRRLMDRLPKLSAHRFVKRRLHLRAELAFAEGALEDALKAAEDSDRLMDIDEPRLLLARIHLQLGNLPEVRILFDNATRIPARHWHFGFGSAPGVAGELAELARTAKVAA